jgi:16S rRNA (cytosine1402-N4)-methyltransferase
MLSEVERYLVNDTGGTYVDCTFGGGGHSGAIISKHPDIRIIAMDCDKEAVAEAEKLGKVSNGRLSVVRENFKNVKAALSSLGVEKVNGLLLDLGISSHQVDDRGRGFSFSSECLDMRMDDRLKLTAGDVLNTFDEQQLADIFYQYGEEHRSRPIAGAIVRERMKGVKLTPEVIVSLAARVKGWSHKINPATKVFQALRIYVNGELESLEMFLKDAPGILKPCGRIVVMSYHSLEDRLVKFNFRELDKEGVYKVLTKKVVTASEEELSLNPRGRSAKLRAAERLNTSA